MIPRGRTFAPRFVVAAAAVIAVATTAAQERPLADPVIAAARAAAAVYTASLPDYAVKRVTVRRRGTRPDLSSAANDVPSWQLEDTISADMSVTHGHEFYRNITVNGKPVNQLPGGAWSGGEFATQLTTILPVERAARFTHQRAESVRHHPSYCYDYAVDEAHSGWRLRATNLPGAPAASTYSTAFDGVICIDRASGHVLRIEMTARGLPAGFPLRSIESETDYDFVKISDSSYVLPTRSISLTCERSSLICLKNETGFQNYRKVSADATEETPK